MCYNQAKQSTGDPTLNFIKLIALNLKLTLLRFLQQVRIIPFYFSSELWKIDWSYFCTYWKTNPYQVCKDYFKSINSEETHHYGDTWPSQVPKFIAHLPIRKEDVLFDLGSGIGRISFWFQKLSGCEVVAVEKVPYFVQEAKKIQEKIKAQNITFLEQDILETDFSRATLIYFYGTSFSDTFIHELLAKWESLKAGTRIVTTSFHLNEYLEEKAYQVKRQYQVSYPWGSCDVYLQEKLDLN